MKKNNYRNVVLPDMGLNHTKIHYKPYFSSLPKRNKDSPQYISPIGHLEIQQAETIINVDVQPQTIVKLKNKIAPLCEKLNERLLEQWNLYLTKAEIYSQKNFQWIQLESFLLKMILEFAQKMEDYHEQIEQLREKEHSNQIPLTCISNINKTNICERFNRTHNLNTNNTNILNQTLLKQLNKTNKVCKSSTHKDKHQINELTCYISKLEKEASLFQQKIQDNEDEYKKKIVTLQEEINKSAKYQYMEVLQEKMKFQNEIEMKKSLNQSLVKEIRGLRSELSIISAKLQQSETILKSLMDENATLQKFKRYRELWLMEHEEIQYCKIKIHELNMEKENLLKNNVGLKQKLKEVSKNFNYNYNAISQTQQTKQDLNQILKEFRDWLQFISVPRIASGMTDINTFFPEMTLPKNSQQHQSYLPKDDLTNYRLLRPNFFIFFQAYQSIIITQKKFPQRKSMPPDFYLTIRAMMDSLYTHFSFAQTYKEFVSFPEFVLGFMDKFQINPQTRKIVQRKMPCHSEDKINFLLNVFNISAANSWECELFRSFLLQQYTLDEIYFYLNCRHSLFKGSQVNNNWGSSDAVVLVKVSVAEDVIYEKLKSYEKEMIDKLRKLVKMKKKNKMGRQFIDSNFVLKLLMEVYSIEKVKSQKFFHHNFRLKAQGNKISYAEYYSFMEKNFPFLLSQDIAQLFRETYGLSLGNITYKSIHYICSVKGLFIVLLKEKMLKKTKNPSKEIRQFNDILYIDLQNCISGLSMDIEQFGLEGLLGAQLKMNTLLRQSDNYRSQKTIFQWQLLKQTSRVLKIKSLLAWKYTNSILFQQISKDDLRDLITSLLSIAHHGDHYLGNKKKLKEKRQKAVKLLTHNFKIRIQQSLSQFNVVSKRRYSRASQNSKFGEQTEKKKRKDSHLSGKRWQ